MLLETKKYRYAVPVRTVVNYHHTTDVNADEQADCFPGLAVSSLAVVSLRQPELALVAGLRSPTEGVLHSSLALNSTQMISDERVSFERRSGPHANYV